MFSAISYATCAMTPIESPHGEITGYRIRGVHKAALIADCISAIALVIFGVMAPYLGCSMPSSMQFLITGIGAGYSLAIVSFLSLRFKERFFPNTYLIPIPRINVINSGRITYHL